MHLLGDVILLTLTSKGLSKFGHFTYLRYTAPIGRNELKVNVTLTLVMLLRYLNLLVTGFGKFSRGAHWNISTCIFNVWTWLDLLTKSHEFEPCPLIGIMTSLMGTSSHSTSSTL